MASHSTRARNLRASLTASHSTRAREGNLTNGPRRMVLSERMGAGESKGKTPAPVPVPCFVYVLQCADDSYYIGATCDLLGRERTHNDGHGSVYTAARRPVRLIYSERLESWPEARKREAQIKRWTRSKKDALIAGNRARLHELAGRRRR